MKAKTRRVGALIAVLATGLATVSLMAVPAGAGTAIPAELDFGRVESGSESAPQSVEIRLDAYERVVYIIAPELEFPVVSETCTGVTGPATCDVTIKFAPKLASTRGDSPVSNMVSVVICDSRVQWDECRRRQTATFTDVLTRGVSVQPAGFRPTSIAITGPASFNLGTTAQFVFQLKDDINNPINGQRLRARAYIPAAPGTSTEVNCDGTTGTLPATSSRPQIDGAVLCDVTPQFAGTGRVFGNHPSNADFGFSLGERFFTIDPPALAPPPSSLSSNDQGQAQQGLTIEETDQPPALAPPPSSLTNNTTPPPAASTSTQAPPMTPLQMAQQTVASFTPSQLAAMTPKQVSGVAASLVSPQQMASMSITDRLQVAGLIQQLVAASVRGKLAAAGLRI